jgi:hypothetical protein
MITHQGPSKINQHLLETNLKLNVKIPLSRIFEEMGNLVSSGMVTTFYATRTTLEQVFISFARFQHDFSKHGTDGLGGANAKQM